MADAPVLKRRLKEIEDRNRGECDPVCPTMDVRYLLRLTRALLESLGELFDALESEHESEFMGINGCTQSRPGRQCRRCELLNRSEKVRKGEV